MATKASIANLGISNPSAFMAELIRNDFASFVIGAYPHIRGGGNLLPNWHLDAIAFELQRIFNGHNHRLLVTLPPRNLKSLMISVMWVAWCLGHNPRMNFVCVSHPHQALLGLRRHRAALRSACRP